LVQQKRQKHYKGLDKRRTFGNLIDDIELPTLFEERGERTLRKNNQEQQS